MPDGESYMADVVVREKVKRWREMRNVG